MAKIEKIEGLDFLQKNRLKDTDWMADAINKAMRQSGLAVQGEAVILAPINTGALRQSITTEVDTQPPFASWVAVGPTVNYGRFVEHGRKPGRMPPISALEPWVRTKLKARNPRAVAYIIARKIAAEGVEAQPFLFPAWFEAQPAVKRILMKLGRDLFMGWKKKTK